MSSQPRYPLLAFVLCCLAGGWGLLYVGKLKAAIRVAALLYGGALLLGLSGVAASPLGILLFFSYVIGIKLVSAVAAARYAHQASSAVRYPRKRVHACYVGALLLITLLLSDLFRAPLLGFRTYSIPSGSMAPTLSIGDYIVSDLRPGPLKVGDIVVHRRDGIDMVKRIAGLPGDTLALVDGHLIRNGQDLGLFFAPAERSHRDYSQQLAPVHVEAGQIYLLGDNRDNSTDSRYYGQVPLDTVSGRVTGIWFAKDFTRIGTRFD